jgi:hypothetical protein
LCHAWWCQCSSTQPVTCIHECHWLPYEHSLISVCSMVAVRSV